MVYWYILIIPGFGIVSTVVAANSNKSIFGQDGSLIGIIQLTQQAICRDFKSWYNNSLLLNTKISSNMLYSFLVTILVILKNPQITKTRSENFKYEIIKFFVLCMLVGISEAIRLLSTSSSLMMKYKYLNNIMMKYSIILKNSLSLYKMSKTISLSKDIKAENISSIYRALRAEDINTDIGTSNSDKSKDNSIHSVGGNNKFNEWLAGLIDGDGCFQLSKKGYASLEIVMELRDKHCLYQIKQKFGGSVKLHAGNNHLRYRLHHKAGLLNLIHAVNGLIRNPVRILQLGKICAKYDINLIDTQPLTYYSGWLAGFFDSDGSIYMNDISGQLFITASQKNRFILDALVELYGGQIYTMAKVGAFKWTCFRKNEILSLVNDYFKVNPSRSEKWVRLNMANQFYELRQQHAHKATPNSVLGKVWKNYLVKWNRVVSKDK